MNTASDTTDITVYILAIETVLMALLLMDQCLFMSSMRLAYAAGRGEEFQAIRWKCHPGSGFPLWLRFRRNKSKTP
jgi:hypothetical protein